MIGLLESEAYSERALETYKSLGKLVFPSNDLRLPPETNVLVVRLRYRVDRNFLASLPSLKFIITPTTGVDHIDLEHCLSLGIRVVSLNDIAKEITSVSSTAEHALGLVIALARRSFLAHNAVTFENSWDRDSFKGRQLTNLQLGIIGYGRLGKKLHELTSNLFASIVAFDPVLKAGNSLGTNARATTLESLITESDVVSIHAPGSKGLVVLDRQRISLLKEGALVVNTARGSLVDEDALAEGMVNGRLGGVAVDVLSGEPFPAGSGARSPLISLARQGHNVIITPHLGGATLEAMAYTENLLAEHFKTLATAP